MPTVAPLKNLQGASSFLYSKPCLIVIKVLVLYICLKMNIKISLFIYGLSFLAGVGDDPNPNFIWLTSWEYF